MSSNIRWRQKDINTLKRAVKNFNERIRYYEKRMDSEFKTVLPERVSFKELRKSISTREDFNKYVKNLQSFNKTTAQPVFYEGRLMTKYELNSIKQAQRSINARRARMRKEADVNTEKGTMGTIEANNLMPRKINFQTIPQEDIHEFMRTLFYQSTDKYYEDKDMLYKVNFMKAAMNAFGIYGLDLILLVNKIDHKDLAKMLFDNPVLSIDFIYGEEELFQRVDNMMEEIQQYIDDNNIAQSNNNMYDLGIVLDDNYQFDRDNLR